MFRVAVLQFPGTNCEHETKRQLALAGLAPEFVRWNEREKLPEYDAYVLPGGFAYEDRSRAGIIAAQDPAIQIIKEQAAKGKPVIGICNGCQILVESGMVPGIANDALAGGVAMNTRVKGGQVIGTGFYHDRIYLKNIAPQGRSCVTMNMPQDAVIPASVANGEGRFIFPRELMLELEKHNQLLFKYCTEEGELINEFPTVPNGAMWGAAGLTNKQGNVVAYMPHPERLDTGVQLFESLRMYLENTPPVDNYDIAWQPPTINVEPYAPADSSTQMVVDLQITDNAAKTVELALKQKGYDVSVSRSTHWEIIHHNSADEATFVDALVQSGELLNTSKETYVAGEVQKTDNAISFLVRYSDDYEGKAVAETLKHRFHMEDVDAVNKGIIWRIAVPAERAGELEALAAEILQTYVLHNPYSQTCYIIE